MGQRQHYRTRIRLGETVAVALAFKPHLKQLWPKGSFEEQRNRNCIANRKLSSSHWKTNRTFIARKFRKHTENSERSTFPI